MFVGLLEYSDTGFLFDITELGSICAVDDDGLQLYLIHAFVIGVAFTLYSQLQGG